MEEVDRAAICKIAYEESTKGLALQDATLTSIRQSCAVLATLTTVIATFLGKEVLAGYHDSTEFCNTFSCRFSIGVAVGTTIIAIGLVAEILRPRTGWIFHSSPCHILDQFAVRGSELTLSDTYDKLARFNEENAEGNSKLLEQLFKNLNALMTTLPVQIAAWLFALA